MSLNFLPILRSVTLKGGVGGDAIMIVGGDNGVADINGQES